MEYTDNLLADINLIKYENFNANTTECVKEGLIHYLYCMYLSKNSETYSKNIKLNKLSPSQEFPIIFQESKSTFFDSIYYNALIAQNILHEDIHQSSNSHPGIIIFSSSLITAKHLKTSGKLFIESIVAGYETMCTIGEDIDKVALNNKGFRPTSIFGVLGSAISVSKLLELNSRKTANALSLAGNMSSGLNSWAYDGTEELFIQNGFAAKNGAIAAFLAKEDINSADEILENKSGFFNAFGGRIPTYRKKSVNQIEEIKYKLIPACALIQSAGMIGIQMKDINSGLIDRIELETHMLGKNYPGCDFKGPYNSIIQARMSNQYLLSSSLINNNLSNKIYEYYYDEKILNLSKKIDIIINEEYTHIFPDKQPMKASVFFKNGNISIYAVEDSKYFSREDIKENFIKTLEDDNKKKVGLEIINLIENLENLDNIDPLFDLIELIK